MIHIRGKAYPFSHKISQKLYTGWTIGLAMCSTECECTRVRYCEFLLLVLYFLVLVSFHLLNLALPLIPHPDLPRPDLPCRGVAPVHCLLIIIIACHSSVRLA